ncbi:MAG: transferrin-binding protein-like solute binding protein [Cardiobacteriaceae bacterium]|nr:transferrin-binding protein-like solute binding protein [Cardiobacteriaceae bacterium]
MNKLTIAIITSALLLSACGGNQQINFGSDGVSGYICDSNGIACVSGNSHNSNNSNNSNQQKNQANSAKNYVEEISGQVIIETGTVAKRNTQAIKTISNQLNTVIFNHNSATYTITKPAKEDENFATTDMFLSSPLDDDASLFGKNLSYSRYGIAQLTHQDDFNQKVVFSQGYLTSVENMPTSGIINYKGAAAMWKYNQDAYLPFIGKAELTADFDAKKVRGNISNLTSEFQNKTADDIKLEGNISANKVAGSSTEGTRLDAAFYGPNAAELSGSFVNDGEDFKGSFGAKKQ